MILNTFIKTITPCNDNRRVHYYIELMNWFSDHGLVILSKRIEKKMLRKYSCEIGRGVDIDRTAKFRHLTGVVIGHYVKIGKHCRIHQNVTLGANVGSETSRSRKFMPIIGDNVWIFSGAVVAGKVCIGDNVIISANSVITRDVPANSLAYGYNQVKPLKSKEVTLDDCKL